MAKKTDQTEIKDTKDNKNDQEESQVLIFGMFAGSVVCSITGSYACPGIFMGIGLAIGAAFDALARNKKKDHWNHERGLTLHKYDKKNLG